VAALEPALPSLEPSLLRDAGLPYLSLYKSKVALWGGYLLAQWGVARAVSLDETATMAQEAADLRNAHAWSIPTSAALAAMCRHSPLVELAAGNGLWAKALLERGADVLAFDTEAWQLSFAEGGGAAGGGEGTAAGEGAPFTEGEALMGAREACVEQGGPEAAAAHPDRALVLMWPDYGGRGSYGLACLRAYRGDRLLLVGEWRGATFGRRSESGESFSAEFQREVEAGFVREELHRLPTWPGSLDHVAVWRRRRA